MLGDGAPSHAVVDSAVELVRGDPDTKRMAGMANAVLRNVLRGEPDWAALPVPSLPKWLRKPLVADYGKEVVAAIEAAHVRGAPVDVTPKAGRAEAVAAATGGTVLPTGSVRLPEGVQVSTLPGFAEGEWWVQDAAAALPVRVLDPKPGERVLDLCAAPGGKTLQLADAGAEVTALDISAARLDRVRENLARTGLTATVVEADALAWEDAGGFDAVLLDAPCSATGTIRRHPDLPFAKAGSDLTDLLSPQARLIDRALDLTRPGGCVVYCTCSLLKDEGERQVTAALARHPGLAVVSAEFPWLDPAWRTDEGGLRLRPDVWPESGGLDGFFIARFRKPG
jgi:16S rRNA (cytosine967-C5)-methyltransferase